MKYSHKDYISISTNTFGEDYQLFKSIVNIGIDSHLEAFAKSKFFYDCGRFHFHFHKSEKHILLRRLNELLNRDNYEFISDWINNVVDYDLITYTEN